MLIENQAWLNSFNPELVRLMKALASSCESKPIEVVPAKNGEPTIKLTESNGISFFLQSQYNPYNEAHAFAQGLVKPGDDVHVLFYGLGLGYHVEAFLERFPEVSISLFEPFPAVFHHYAKTRPMNKIPGKNVKHIFAEISMDLGNQCIDVITKSTNKEIWVVVHPAYQRHFKKRTDSFFERYKSVLQRQRTNITVDLRFQKRWTINSLLNFPYLLNTANIFDFKAVFKDKPVILVSAGPSLHDEIENLRKIKEDGTAFIIAVGSSNKALLHYGLKPDAVSTYDPSEFNKLVFEDMVNQGVSDVPMIFGSSVGHESITNFPGPKLHMFISQDHVTKYYLEKERKGNPTINDATSIAVVTLELLAHLGASPVILVGQNLAVRGEEIYSQGIHYDRMQLEENNKWRKNLVETKSVDGSAVFTIPDYVTMRLQMEQLIKHYGLKVLNTTRNGAAIEGTKFLYMDEVMKDLNKRVVDPRWYQSVEPKYSISGVLEKGEELERSMVAQQELLDELMDSLKRIDYAMNMKSRESLSSALDKLEKKFEKLQKNEFHIYFCEPMLKVANKKILSVKYELKQNREVNVRGKMIMDSYGRYVYEAQLIVNQFRNIIPAIHKKIRETLLINAK